VLGVGYAPGSSRAEEPRHPCDGKTAKELALEAGVTPPTASRHLTKLLDGRLLAVETQRLRPEVRRIAADVLHRIVIYWGVPSGSHPATPAFVGYTPEKLAWLPRHGGYSARRERKPPVVVCCTGDRESPHVATTRGDRQRA
jgi:DNA-binding transcriptional ArsR family regulator